VKLPLPVQPVPPVSDHVPEIEFPFAVPDSVSVFPAGFPDVTTNPNLPVTFPLKFPLSVNDPLSVSPDTKHGEFVEKLKLVMLNDPSPDTINAVANAKTVLPPESVRVAVQFPLMLPELFLLEPHPASARIITNNIAAPNFFIRKHSSCC
jgi:hypothetical protein